MRMRCITQPRARGGTATTWFVEHVDPALANSWRRVCMQDLPAIAIEFVHVLNNDSLTPDEVLALKLGLLRWTVEPERLAPYAAIDKTTHIPTDRDTLVFTLEVEAPDDGVLRPETVVYARDVRWTPLAEQRAQWPVGCEPRATHPDVPLAKLRPGQRLRLVARAHRATGAAHAKFMVTTRVMMVPAPWPTLLAPVEGEEAVRLRDVCPQKVFDLEEGRLCVRKPLACVRCLRCLPGEGGMAPDVAGAAEPSRIELQTIENSYLLTIESGSHHTPGAIAVNALDELWRQLSRVQTLL